MPNLIRSDGPCSPEGVALVAARRWLDCAEAAWLADLATFDRSRRFAGDGCLDAVVWLQRMCLMARSTAKERLRVAHALTDHPVVRRALEAGRISYSQARAITRLHDATKAVDYAMVKAAKKGATARELDGMVAYATKTDRQGLTMLSNAAGSDEPPPATG